MTEQGKVMDELLDAAAGLRIGGMPPSTVSELFLRAALSICITHHGLDLTVATLRHVADQFAAGGDDASMTAGFQLQ